jgi:hypothetical protein
MPEPRIAYRFLILLADTEPLVWRRIVVPMDASFWALHVAIQDAMGWLDMHLHEFEVVPPWGGHVAHIGLPDPELGRRVKDGRRCRLETWFRPQAMPARYRYDFGDDWCHIVECEDYETMDDGPYPRCLDGGGACPPEDCGGTHGYRELLRIQSDPDDPDHAGVLEWIGGPIDPHAFSPEAVHFEDPAVRAKLAFP